jgi:hypothetical protein
MLEVTDEGKNLACMFYGNFYIKTQRKVLSDFPGKIIGILPPFFFVTKKFFFRIFRKNVEFFFFNEIDCKKFCYKTKEVTRKGGIPIIFEGKSDTTVCWALMLSKII